MGQKLDSCWIKSDEYICESIPLFLLGIRLNGAIIFLIKSKVGPWPEQVDVQAADKTMARYSNGVYNWR